MRQVLFWHFFISNILELLFEHSRKTARWSVQRKLTFMQISYSKNRRKKNRRSSRVYLDPPYISLNPFLLVLWRFKCNAYHLQAYMPFSRICSVCHLHSRLSHFEIKTWLFIGGLRLESKSSLNLFIFVWVINLFIYYFIQAIIRIIQWHAGDDMIVMVDFIDELINTGVPWESSPKEFSITSQHMHLILRWLEIRIFISARNIDVKTLRPFY